MEVGGQVHGKAEQGVDSGSAHFLLGRGNSYSFLEEFIASRKGQTAEEEAAFELEKELELRSVRRWHYVSLLLTSVDAIGQFSCQLLYSVGINKTMQVVFGTDFRSLIDETWEIILMYDVSFEVFIGILIAVLSMISLASALLSAVSYRSSKRVHRLIQLRIAEKILTQQNSFSFDELLDLTKSAGMVERYLAEVMYAKVWAYVVFVVGLAFIFGIAPLLALILTSMFAAVLICVVLFGKFFLSSRKRRIDQDESLVEEIMIDIVGMKDVILLNEKNDSEVHSLVSMGNKSMPTITQTAKLIIASSIVQSAVTLLTVPVLLVYTFYTVRTADDLFQLILVILSCFQFNVAFQRFVLLEQRSEEFYIAQERLKQFIDTRGLEFIFGKSKKDEDDGQQDLDLDVYASESLYVPDDKYLIQLQRVSASYVRSQDRSDWILRDIDLNIVAGDRIVILGETGSGKSTLLKVILGFLKPLHGKMFVDGETLVYRHEDLMDWRKQVTVVSQDSPMFRRTLRDNITYGLVDVSDEDLAEACERACLTKWIASLPYGLDTLLGNREKQLSGGQRQRIQICRAFLREQQVVIMDEPTAALDPETTGTILNNIADYFQGKTALCITHDLAMLRIFTRVFRLTREHGLVEDS